tara:strand:- start:8198 stop:8545 length:348 start_codon:yes stop_codon:yes gene_type:complete
MKTPDTNPKTAQGMKKCPVQLVPAQAIREEAEAMRHGADKYGEWNWRVDGPISASIYYGAAMRHLMLWYEGEDLDAESGQSHLGHARACLAIIIDGLTTGGLNDDRPPHFEGDKK